MASAGFAPLPVLALDEGSVGRSGAAETEASPIVTSVEAAEEEDAEAEAEAEAEADEEEAEEEGEEGSADEDPVSWSVPADGEEVGKEEDAAVDVGNEALPLPTASPEDAPEPAAAAPALPLPVPFPLPLPLP